MTYKFDSDYTLTAITGYPANALASTIHALDSAGLATVTDRNTDRTFDFSATLNYQVTPTAMLYASFGRGNKGAAYNNQAALFGGIPDSFLILRETATSYEVGVKGRFLNNRLYASLAGFILDVHNFQDSHFDPAIIGFVFNSIEEAKRELVEKVLFAKAPVAVLNGDPSGNRTRVSAVRGPRPDR